MKSPWIHIVTTKIESKVWVTLSHERWDPMKCIHFVIPNMTEKGQACTPKKANVPHYQLYTGDDPSSKFEKKRQAIL
jgi:hypothetical protein